MLKIATVRVTEDFLEELSNFVKNMKLGKSSYLRDILKRDSMKTGRKDCC